MLPTLECGREWRAFERLAFPINDPLEADLHKIWASPPLRVISVLEKYRTYQEVYDHLPEIE